jgi:hypothetical protein
MSGDGPLGPRGGGATRARGREVVGPDSTQPRGEKIFLFLFLFPFLFPFLLSPFSFEQIFSYIFLGVKKYSM